MKTSHFFCSSRNLAKIDAFTQLEIVVGTSILLALAGLLFGICNSALEKRGMVQELSAGKTLITAYTTCAIDNGGRYLPGMDNMKYPNPSTGKENMGVSVPFKPTNKSIAGPAAVRYPYRLAPYFDYQMRGVIRVSQNGQTIDELSQSIPTMYDYYVSVYPCFGLNYLLVGGIWSGPSSAPAVEYADDIVTKQGEAEHSILVFASAGIRGPDGAQVTGHHYVTPPQYSGERWDISEWSKDKAPNNYGHVDARHGGKAICAYTDGSVRTQTIEELRDMRLWSKNAALNNDPNYSF